MSVRARSGLAVPATAAIVLPLLLAFAGLPLALVLWKAVAGGPGVFAEVLAGGPGRSAVRNSVSVAAGVAGVAVLLGGPLGAALARLDLRGGRALGTLLVLPLAVPSYVWAMAWIALAAPRSGWLNRAAAALGATHPPFDIFGLPGIVFVEGLSLFPLVLLPTR